MITKKDGVTCLNFDCSGFVQYYLRQRHKLKALQEIRNYVAKQKNWSDEQIHKVWSHEYVSFFKNVQNGQ